MVEKLGIPTTSLIASAFLKQAEVIAKGLGVPLAISTYPGDPMVDSEEELRRKVDQVIAPGVLNGLTGGALRAAKTKAEPEPGQIVFRGSFDEVQDYFHRELWSDGLPVVPPTRQRVDAFLAFTEREPDEVMRVLPPEGREATILSIAVNGVMAGCRPEYMPILIAAVECLCDPDFRIEDAGSTPGWEPLVILNGPVIKELEFNYEQGVMRVGRQANSSIGRFMRMFMRNICGYRTPPGAGDKASIGQSFLVALAENEDWAHEIGWPTLAEDRGYAPRENVVTVQSVVCITPPTYSAGARAVVHLQQWADVMGQTFRYWSHTGFKRGLWHPLIVAGPSIAKVIARELSKDRVRQYLYENIKVTAEAATRYANMTNSPTFSLERLVKQGILPPDYAASGDPQRLVNVIIKPEMINIMISGDPGRNQSRGYMGNQIQGPPTSRRVELPQDWARRLKLRK